VVPLILAFAVLTTLVVDLDRPQRGLIKVSQQEMIDLKKSMEREDAFNKKILQLKRGSKATSAPQAVSDSEER